jgi:hypothetical protein
MANIPYSQSYSPQFSVRSSRDIHAHHADRFVPREENWQGDEIATVDATGRSFQGDGTIGHEEEAIERVCYCRYPGAQFD